MKYWNIFGILSHLNKGKLISFKIETLLNVRNNHLWGHCVKEKYITKIL